MFSRGFFMLSRGFLCCRVVFYVVAWFFDVVAWFFYVVVGFFYVAAWFFMLSRGFAHFLGRHVERHRSQIDLFVLISARYDAKESWPFGTSCLKPSQSEDDSAFVFGDNLDHAEASSKWEEENGEQNGTIKKTSSTDAVVRFTSVQVDVVIVSVG